jgi:hypothetical protein
MGCSSPSQNPEGTHHLPRHGSIARRVRRSLPSWMTSAPAAGLAFSQCAVLQAPQTIGAGVPIGAPQAEQKRGIPRER